MKREDSYLLSPSHVASVIEQTKSVFGTQVWKMPNMLNELIREVQTKAYRDDILRTVQLIFKR